MALHGALRSPLGGEAVILGVELARQPATEYFEGGLSEEDEGAVEGTPFTSA